MIRSAEVHGKRQHMGMRQPRTTVAPSVIAALVAAAMAPAAAQAPPTAPIYDLNSAASSTKRLHGVAIQVSVVACPKERTKRDTFVAVSASGASKTSR